MKHIKKISVFLQYVLPKHLISIAAGKLAHIKTPWFKNWFIKTFMRAYRVSLEEAVIDVPTAYENFNAFFTRHLKPSARPIDQTKALLVSPVDGTIAQLGSIQHETLLQAKGHAFQLADLLGDKMDASFFVDGSFATLYLAPHNYHRVHMPYEGKLIQEKYIPGKLFSVNLRTASIVSNLFSRNERLVTLFETPLGKMALVFVGAMIVGSIKTVWQQAPYAHHLPLTTLLPMPLTFNKGDELGHFQLGSTVILLLEKQPTPIVWRKDSMQTIQLGCPLIACSSLRV